MKIKPQIWRIAKISMILLLTVMGVFYFYYRMGWGEVPSFLIRGEEGKVLAKALWAYKNGDYASAAANYRRYTVLAPDDPEGWYGLAVSHGQGGELHDAYRAAQRALELNPGDRKVRSTLALLHIGLKEYLQAIAIYEKLLKENAHDQMAQANRAFAYYRWGKIDEAVKYYRIAVKEFPGSPELRYSLGMIQYDMESFDEALQQFREATFLNLKYEEAYLMMARCALALGDPDDAVLFAEKSVELTGKDKDWVKKEAEELLLKIDGK